MKYLVFSIKILNLICILYTLYSILNTRAYADTSQGDNFIFHMNVNTDPDQGDQLFTKPIKKFTPTPTPFSTITATPTPTPIPPPIRSIRVGYTDTEPVTDFSFTISDDIVNLGPLLPGDIINRDNTLEVRGDPSYQYSIMAYENHQLHNDKNTIIPNTTCDDGSCSSTTASIWTDVLTYGFGYRCDNNTGHDCDSNLQNLDTYRQFADKSVQQPEIALASGITNGPRKETITYKLNIAGTQQAGNYTNTITYLALPMY